MSDKSKDRINFGAYRNPFSGVGVEFYPLGVQPGRSGVTLHEAGYLQENAHWNFPSVFGQFWRLYYNSERGHCFLFGDRMVELLPDQIVLIPDRNYFHCLGEQSVPSFWIAFSFIKSLHRSTQVPVILDLRDTERCIIRDLCNLIGESEFESESEFSKEAVYRNSLALLQVVLARRELTWQPPIPDKLVQIKNYIDVHYHEKLTNPVLARRIGMGVTGFERAFKRHYDSTVAQYIIETRVREASRWLLQSGASIDEIAEKTGFPNRAYFSRVFKRVTGESPAAFRRKHGS